MRLELSCKENVARTRVCTVNCNYIGGVFQVWANLPVTSMASVENAAIEMPALGRPFQLGMLYDCRTDSIIPGNYKTLIPFIWGRGGLQAFAVYHSLSQDIHC